MVEKQQETLVDCETNLSRPSFFVIFKLFFAVLLFSAAIGFRSSNFLAAIGFLPSWHFLVAIGFLPPCY
jgi:hypothetical protein